MQSRIRKTTRALVLRHEDAPAGATGATGPADTGATGATGTTAAAPKTFTQEELDRHIADRLARQKAQFADYDDAKAKAAKFDDLEAANKSELEKATARAEAAERARADSDAKAAETDMRAAIVAAAATAGAADPKDIVAMLDRSGITVGDDGVIAGVDDAVSKLLTAKPYLKSAGDGRPSGDADLGGKPGGEPTDFRNANKDDVDAERRRMGVGTRRY